MYEETADDIAGALLSLTSTNDIGEYVPPEVIAKCCGVTLVPTAPRGCNGALLLEPLVIRYRNIGRRGAVVALLGHELGHLAAELHETAVHEDDVNAVGAAVIMPRWLCLDALERVGLDPRGLISALPDVPMQWVLARMAIVSRGALVYRIGRRRHVIGADDEVRPAPWEADYLARAAASPSRTYTDREGVTAAVLTHRASAILVPHDVVWSYLRRTYDDSGARGCGLAAAM